MENVIEQLVDSAKKRLSGKEHVNEFIKELEAIPYKEGGGYQGPPGSLHRMVSMQDQKGRLNVQSLYEEWAFDREAQIAKAVRQRYLDSTYEVTYAKGKRWGKPERVPKEEADKPWKPGHLLMDEKGRIEGRGFDDAFGPSYNLRSLPIGTETPAGVVRGKRQVRTERGLIVQYLIKPWSASGKKKYEAKKRIEKLEHDLRFEVEMMSQQERDKARQELEALKKKYRLG